METADVVVLEVGDPGGEDDGSTIRSAPSTPGQHEPEKRIGADFRAKSLGVTQNGHHPT